MIKKMVSSQNILASSLIPGQPPGKMSPCRVVLLNPPFFKFCGSHNDKMPLSLCYLSAILENHNISHKVFNADFEGSDTYWSMKRLFDNFESFSSAVDDEGSLYDEVINQIQAMGPSVVVIMGADPLVPTKDLGSPFIASNISKRLRKLGVFTVGIGPYFTLDPSRFIHDFDCIMGGEPSESIVNIIHKKTKGFLTGSRLPEGLVPSLNHLYPEGQKTDAVMTSFGCLRGCSFCVAGKLYRALGYGVTCVSPEKVTEDILKRKEDRIYILDLNFSIYPVPLLKKLFEVFERGGVKKEFVVESTVNGVTEERLRLYQKAGVSTIKLGIEGLTEPLLEGFSKKQGVLDIRNAVNIIRKYDIKFIAYMLIGGPAPVEDYSRSIEILKELEPDNVVVSIWAYDLRGDYRYDTQFSPVTLKKWGIEKEVFYDYLRLQRPFNSTVGNIVL